MPSEKRHALKVIHSYLDHPEVGRQCYILCALPVTVLFFLQVACILLANSNMDAAKLNRCLQVSQGAASEMDLLALTEGCLLASDARATSEYAPPPSRSRLLGLCRAFQEVQSDPACWAPHVPRSNAFAGLFHQVRSGITAPPAPSLPQLHSPALVAAGLCLPASQYPPPSGSSSCYGGSNR